MYYVFALPCNMYQCIIVLGLAASIHRSKMKLKNRAKCWRDSKV